jgi:precorrin-6A/cobalt-precorrin-6A reductase
MHPPTATGPVLVLGGTAEGRETATALATSGLRVISSLAGRVAAPRSPPGEVRIGGFGGPDGLAEYLSAERISAVIDATHPFAARITGNAVAACARTGTPLLVLRRPPWLPVNGDRWTTVPDLTAAAAVLTGRHPDAVRTAGPSPDAAVLLTIGRQGVGAFCAAPQRFWLRSIDPPEPPLPARAELILDRGPFTRDGELALLRRLSIDVLVTKNSGGRLTAAKLAATRELGLPVIVIDRPADPPGIQVVPDVPSALTWLLNRLP